MHADDVAPRKNIGEDVECDAVVAVVEGGDEYDAVGDVEIGVAGGDALVAKDDGARHGQLDDGELEAGRRARGFEAPKIFSERDVVGVVGARLDSRDDGVGRDEAGDVVDV